MSQNRLPKDRKELLESLKSAFLVEVGLNGNRVIIGTIELLGSRISVIKTTEGDYIEVNTKDIKIRDFK